MLSGYSFDLENIVVYQISPLYVSYRYAKITLKRENFSFLMQDCEYLGISCRQPMTQAYGFLPTELTLAKRFALAKHLTRNFRGESPWFVTCIQLETNYRHWHLWFSLGWLAEKPCPKKSWCRKKLRELK